MCKNWKDTQVTEPRHHQSHCSSSGAISSRRSSTNPPSSNQPLTTTASSSAAAAATTTNTASTSSSSSSSSSSTLSLASLASLRAEASTNAPAIYSFSELAAATNNFLSRRRLPGSSSAWRCTLSSREVVIFQRPLRQRSSAVTGGELTTRLASLARSHHAAVIPLLGVSRAPPHIYLVYQFISGASLSDCLRNPKNPNFTILKTWVSRIRIVLDIAESLDYIHNQSLTVHNHLKSSSVVITDPGLRAKISHFGAAELTGELGDNYSSNNLGEIEEEEEEENNRSQKRSHSMNKRIERTPGYMAPELVAGGKPSCRSDVYAFGIVLLEILSGEKPFKFQYDKESGSYSSVTLVERARAIAAAEGEVRRWIDRRLRDSFPVEEAERLVKLGLKCTAEDAAERPEMAEVKGKVAKSFLNSEKWEKRVQLPVDISVSLAPR